MKPESKKYSTTLGNNVVTFETGKLAGQAGGAVTFGTPESIVFAAATMGGVREGIDFVLKTKVMLGAITLDLFAVLFGGAVALIPVFARDILHVGPIGFGWLNAAADIGSIIMVTISSTTAGPTDSVGSLTIST